MAHFSLCYNIPNDIRKPNYQMGDVRDVVHHPHLSLFGTCPNSDEDRSVQRDGLYVLSHRPACAECAQRRHLYCRISLCVSLRICRMEVHYGRRRAGQGERGKKGVLERRRWTYYDPRSVAHRRPHHEDTRQRASAPRPVERHLSVAAPPCREATFRL